MKDIKQQIIDSISQAVAQLSEENVDIKLEVPEDPRNGDYSTSIALQLSKKLGKSPRDIAQQIADILNTEYGIQNTVNKVDIAGPGFLNFYLSDSMLVSNLSSILQEKDKYGSSKVRTNMRIMVEFAHPNTHKDFHIGHLRNISTGESICRLLTSQGADVARVNYEGDVGMHVAKAMFGVAKLLAEKNASIEKIGEEPAQEKAKFLGEAYALGSKYFEEDEEAKKEITALNKKIYAKDPEIVSLWEKTRSWSLEYFDSIYKKVDTHFERLFFESEVFESGKEIVLSHVKDGIFVEDQGAVIFPGEKHGLHNRVFVTSEGNPTYEGKEMGLGPLQYKEFHFDEALHVVGPEQAGYFEVVFKALELVDPIFEGREKHVSYGFVTLKDGKMSSRLGNIVRGEWLLDEARKKLLEAFPDMTPEVAEVLSVGAVKYSMLKVARAANIQFSFEESINLHGNSGPYIQYVYARTRSVLAKSRHSETLSKNPMGSFTNVQDDNLDEDEKQVVRKLVHFPEVVARAAAEFAPSDVCTYLFELSQAFNLFYQKAPILKAGDREALRLAITDATGIVLKNGLNLLGIKTVEKM